MNREPLSKYARQNINKHAGQQKARKSLYYTDNVSRWVDKVRRIMEIVVGAQHNLN